MTKSLLLAATLALLPAIARGAGAGCQDTSGALVLEKVRSGATGSELLGCLNRTIDKISTATAVNTSTHNWLTAGKINVSTIGANGAPLFLSSSVTLGNDLWLKISSTSYIVNYGTASIHGADGLAVTYGVRAGSGSFTSGVTASSVTTRATGDTQYALDLSTGVIFRASATGIVWADGSVSTSARSGRASGAGGHGLSTGAATAPDGGGPFYTMPTRSSMTAVWPLVFVDSATADSTLLKLENYAYVTSTQVYPNGTTTQTTWASGATCYAGSTATWTQGNNRSEICFSGSGTTGASNLLAVGMLLDGAYLPGYDQRANIGCVPNSAECNLSFCATTPALSAGTHNACLIGQVSGNTLTIPSTANENTTAMLAVKELATGGNGYAAPASSNVFMTSERTTSNTGWTTVLGSSASITARGGPVCAEFACPLAQGSGGGQAAFGGITINGVLIGDQNASRGLTFADASWPADVAGQWVTCSTGTYSGEATASAIFRTESGGSAVANPGGNSACAMRVWEERNQPGTGDVSSNGNTGFTGALTFSNASLSGGGQLRQHASTTTVDFWSARGVARTYNDTASTQAQGFMLVNTTFTAKNANSALDFAAHVEGCEPSNTIDMAWLSLHKDNTQAAVCEGGNTHFAGTAVRPTQMVLRCRVSVIGDTSAHVWSLRVQNDTAANAVAVNGCSARFLGGTQMSGLWIDEKAQ